MDLYMIITVSGIFVGMVILIYGIYSYDKLKKDNDSLEDKDIMSSETFQVDNIKDSTFDEPSLKEIEINNKFPEVENDVDISLKDDLTSVEPSLKISHDEEIDLGDTLVFNEEPEKNVNVDKNVEIEDLFD